MELKQSPRLLPLCFNFYLMVILRTKLLFATFLLATGVFGQKIKKEELGKSSVFKFPRSKFSWQRLYGRES